MAWSTGLILGSCWTLGAPAQVAGRFHAPQILTRAALWMALTWACCWAAGPGERTPLPAALRKCNSAALRWRRICVCLCVAAWGVMGLYAWSTMHPWPRYAMPSVQADMFRLELIIRQCHDAGVQIDTESPGWLGLLRQEGVPWAQEFGVSNAGEPLDRFGRRLLNCLPPGLVERHTSRAQRRARLWPCLRVLAARVRMDWRVAATPAALAPRCPSRRSADSRGPGAGRSGACGPGPAGGAWWRAGRAPPPGSPRCCS